MTSSIPVRMTWIGFKIPASVGEQEDEAAVKSVPERRLRMLHVVLVLPLV